MPHNKCHLSSLLLQLQVGGLPHENVQAAMRLTAGAAQSHVKAVCGAACSATRPVSCVMLHAQQIEPILIATCVL